ncbi:hypothetical protein FFF34_012350 [Inquilinus sp. KBS0705]|nr:hypothetical protein FFF34_012350 [Inquilinus sp. KBS0705]
MKDLEVLLILLSAVFSIIITIKWKKSTWKKKISFIACIAASLVIAYNAHEKNKKDDLIDRINSSFGEINDNTDVAVAKMEIGNGGTFFNLGTGVFSIPPNYKDLIKLFVRSNKLFMTAIIRDRKGDVIAAIYENEWTWYKKGYEYNNDENSFEIVTQGDRNVFFNVNLKKGIAQVTGFFYTADGYGLQFYHDDGKDYSVMFKITPTTLDTEIPQIIEKPIFKYPRERYMGIRASKN